MTKTLGFASPIPVPCVKGERILPARQASSYEQSVDMNSVCRLSGWPRQPKPSLRGAGIALWRTVA